MFSSNGVSPTAYERMMLQERVGAAALLYSPYYPSTNTGTGSSHGSRLEVSSSAPAPIPVYSGKWTLEEESYVTALCEEFRAGSLNVPEGKSLRCFLADQLGCNAKRISKKYERTGYNGKLQYVDKRSSMTDQEKTKRQEELKELDRKFRESRETLKIVEASRKRSAPADSDSGGPSLVKAARLTPMPMPIGTRMSMGIPMPVLMGMPMTLPMGAMNLIARPAAAAAAATTTAATMDSLVLRRSILARQQYEQLQCRDLAQASMLSSLHKYGATAAVPVHHTPAIMQARQSYLKAARNPHHAGLFEVAGDLPTLSSVAAMLETQPIATRTRAKPSPKP